MRQLLLKVTLSGALTAGLAAAAMACPFVTASQEESGYLQLAQAGGGGGGSSGGSGSSSGGGVTGGTSGSSSTGATSPGTSGTTGATTGPAANPSTSGGGGAQPIIPPNTPMRQPITPSTPDQPGQTQPVR